MKNIHHRTDLHVGSTLRVPEEHLYLRVVHRAEPHLRLRGKVLHRVYASVRGLDGEESRQIGGVRLYDDKCAHPPGASSDTCYKKSNGKLRCIVRKLLNTFIFMGVTVSAVTMYV